MFCSGSTQAFKLGVGQLFVLNRDSRLIGVMVIKTIGKSWVFGLDIISFFFLSGLQLNIVSRYVYRLQSQSSLMRKGNL